MSLTYTYRNIEYLPPITLGFNIHVSATFQNYEFEEFKIFVPSLLLDNFFSALVGMVPNQIVVTDEHFWKTKAHELYSEKMWENIKAKLLYNVITIYD